MLIVNKQKDTIENISCCYHKTGISTQCIYAFLTLHTNKTVSRNRVN